MGNFEICHRVPIIAIKQPNKKKAEKHKSISHLDFRLINSRCGAVIHN